MNTPEQAWESYREFVYENTTLTSVEEHNCQQAFYAGSEAVFKILADSLDLHPNEIFRIMQRYREMNRTAAMETVPDDEQEEQL